MPKVTSHAREIKFFFTRQVALSQISAKNEIAGSLGGKEESARILPLCAASRSGEQFSVWSGATSRVSGFSGCIQVPVRVGTLTSSDTNEHLLVSYAAHGRSKLIALILNVFFCSVINSWN